MDNHAQSNGQVFVTPTPSVNQRQRELSGASSATYPPNYRVVTQQQKVSSASDKCKSIFAGRISTCWLGSLLLVSGLVSMVGAVFASTYFAGLWEDFAGIWCGLMMMFGGVFAISAGFQDANVMILIGTIVTSALSIVASITLLAVSGTGLSNDNGTGNGNGYSCYHLCDNPNTLTCRCVDDNYKAKAIASNATLVGVAALTFIAALWILVVVCIAIRRNPVSFQGVSVPAQAQVQYRFVANAAQPNVYENIPHQRGVSVPAQSVANSAPVTVPAQSVANSAPVSVPAQSVANSAPVSVPAQSVANSAQPNIYENIPHQRGVSVPEEAVANDTQSTIYENIPHQQMHYNTRSVRASAAVPATDAIEPSITEHQQSINISSSGLSEC